MALTPIPHRVLGIGFSHLGEAYHPCASGLAPGLGEGNEVMGVSILTALGREGRKYIQPASQPISPALRGCAASGGGVSRKESCSCLDRFRGSPASSQCESRGCGGGTGRRELALIACPGGAQVFMPLAWVNWFSHFVVGLVSVFRKRNRGSERGSNSARSQLAEAGAGFTHKNLLLSTHPWAS